MRHFVSWSVELPFHDLNARGRHPAIGTPSVVAMLDAKKRRCWLASA
jgi:hypothetical protein